MEPTMATQKPKTSEGSDRATETSAEESKQGRTQWIAATAYFKAQARGFAPGRALDDWLEAEKEYSAGAAKPKGSERKERAAGA